MPQFRKHIPGKICGKKRAEGKEQRMGTKKTERSEMILQRI